MRETTDLREPTIDELDLVSGGETGISGNIGSIGHDMDLTGSSVFWPGAVGGIQGTWTMSSKGGVSRHPA